MRARAIWGAFLVTLSTATGVHAEAPTYYVALGDSLAIGIQPAADGSYVPTNHGYVDDLYKLFRSSFSKLHMSATYASMIGSARPRLPPALSMAAATSGSSVAAAAVMITREEPTAMAARREASGPIFEPGSAKDEAAVAKIPSSVAETFNDAVHRIAPSILTSRMAERTVAALATQSQYKRVVVGAQFQLSGSKMVAHIPSEPSSSICTVIRRNGELVGMARNSTITSESDHKLVGAL